MATRKELLAAVITRYKTAPAVEKARILDEFTAVTGYHRKHAIRLLNSDAPLARPRTPRSRLYDEAVKQALIVLWEASDRLCGKRLKGGDCPSDCARDERRSIASSRENVVASDRYRAIIQSAVEPRNVDFKAAMDWRLATKCVRYEILLDIAAMANAGGGVLVVGRDEPTRTTGTLTDQQVVCSIRPT